MTNERAAAPLRRDSGHEERSLTVDIDAGGEQWRIEAGGQVHEVPAPDLRDVGGPSPAGALPRERRDLTSSESAGLPNLADGGPLGAALLHLRSMAGVGLDVDKSGRLINPSDAGIERAMLAVARSIGAALTALLPPAGRSALAADSPSLFHDYEALEIEVSWVRERAAFSMGYEHGAADGRVDVFRSHTRGLREAARRVADQARVLVVNEGLSANEATALLLETAWALVLAKPAPIPGA